MKKILLSLLGILMALPTFAHEFDYTYEGQTLTYTVIDEEAKTVMTKEGYYDEEQQRALPGNDISGALIIPSVAKDGEVEYSVTEIGYRAFLRCSGLTSIEIPNSVTSIGDWAFYGCGLTSVEIPNSVTSISDRAFMNCSSLTSVEIPNSVTSISSSAFSGCSSLTTVEIPNSVTSIGTSAFYSCSSLTSIEIPNSVTSIGDNAFCGCNSMTSVGIPNSLTSIGQYTFSNCSSLTTVEIPNSVTSIGDYSFSGCSSLMSVEIPNSVNRIGTYAFQKCFDITEVYVKAEIPTEPTITMNIFESTVYQNATLYVPEESVNIYKGAFPWKYFRTIKGYHFLSGIESTVGDSDESVKEFYNLSGLYLGNSEDVLAPGIYIVRQGGSVKKIAVK